MTMQTRGSASLLESHRGTWPATIVPFLADGAIDWDSFESHIAQVSSVGGVRAVVVNGHSSQASVLSAEERNDIVRAARQAVGPGVAVVAGVAANAPGEARQQAREAVSAGADGLLLFPADVFSQGGNEDHQLVRRFVGQLVSATDAAVCLFQQAVRAGVAYPARILAELCLEFPQIIAIKEGSEDMVRYEQVLRAVKSVGREVSVLTSNNQNLFATLSVGGDGVLSGMGSVVPDLHSKLLEAIDAGDLMLARRVNDHIYPLAEVFYRAPSMDMHSRMKVALVELGRIPRATVREPLNQVQDDEVAAIREALRRAGLIEGMAR